MSNIRNRLKELQTIYSDKSLLSLISNIPERSYLMHVALPKSGTTWLSNIIANLYALNDWTVSSLVPFYGTRPQEIDPRLFLTSGNKENLKDNIFFVQQHCSWSEYTQKLIEITRTKIIFQSRNLFDVMLSLRDHYLAAIKGNDETSNIPKPLFNKSPEELIDIVIETKCGWYCEFLYGWINSSIFESKNFFKVKYETLKKDTNNLIENLNHELQLGFSSELIKLAIQNSEKSNTRKNIGINNRSDKELNQQQKNKILKVAKYYKLPDEYIFFLN